MSPLRRLSRFFNRHVTILVIPHADLPLFRGRFSLAFLVFGVLLWTGFTVWAGFLSGRQVDYWVTKADNAVLTEKMSYMAKQIDGSREMLEAAGDTDRQLRVLLGMRTRQGVLDADEGVGGPTLADRASLSTLLDAGRLTPAAVRRAAADLRRESSQRLASFQEIAWYITSERSLARATPAIWPTTGHITSPFGYRLSPFPDEEGRTGMTFHAGVDIANQADTPIVATADGVVRYAGWAGGYGLMVLIDHGFGFSTLYGHTSKVAVRVGQRVVRGQPIAYMGTTGRSTGPHVHYEVWRHGTPTDPMPYLTVHPADGDGGA